MFALVIAMILAALPCDEQMVCGWDAATRSGGSGPSAVIWWGDRVIEID